MPLGKGSFPVPSLTFDGPRLRAEREAAGLTLEQVAVSVGLTASAVYGFETGRFRPSAATLGRLADALGVSVGAFYAREVTRVAA